MIRLLLCLKNEVAKIVFFGIRPPFFRNFFFNPLFVTHFLIVGACFPSHTNRIISASCRK